MSGHRNRSRLWTVIVLLVLVTGVAMGGWHRLNQPGPETGTDGAASSAAAAAKDPVPSTERAIALEGERIALRPVQRSVGAVGTFSGYDEVTVMAQVTGPVAQVLHDVGDIVRPGDVLMELDKTDFNLELDQTRRALELEVVRLGVKVPPEFPSMDEIMVMLREFKIENLPSLKRATEQERNAASRVQRAEQLKQSESISQEEYEQRQMEHDLAKSALDQANFDAEAALAAIRHRLALLRIAMRKLELSTIRVPTPTNRAGMPDPIQYTVVERRAAEGEMLKDASGASTVTYELIMDGVLKLMAQVPERYAAEVKLGQESQVRVDAYPDRVFTGAVSRINPTVDRTSRTFNVEILVPNPQRELKGGGFAKVDILTRVDPQAWTISPECVVTYAGSTRVFVVREGKAHTLSVEKGIEGSGWVELIHAVNPDLRRDDIFVRGGQDKLAEGVPVQIRNAAALQQKLELPAKAR